MYTYIYLFNQYSFGIIEFYKSHRQRGTEFNGLKVYFLELNIYFNRYNFSRLPRLILLEKKFIIIILIRLINNLLNEILLYDQLNFWGRSVPQLGTLFEGRVVIFYPNFI